MVGHAALDRGIGVRIPASQPAIPIPSQQLFRRRDSLCSELQGFEPLLGERLREPAEYNPRFVS